MTRRLSLCGAALAAWTLAAATTAPAAQGADNAPIVVADYMRAVPTTSSPVRHCKRVCIKSQGGTATHPGHCVQWQTVC